MSSPRGFAAGGMGGMGRVADIERSRMLVNEGERGRDGSAGRGKKKDSGFQ
jgi:hypothetical protein